MKSVFLSFLVALVSIVVFRERVLDFATTTLTFLRSTSTDSSTAETPNTVTEEPTESSNFYNPAEQLAATDMSIPRAIRKVFLAVEQAEGAGARVRRSIGTPQLRNFSPFLMLDHFSIKPGAGFPDHPHRGQETSEFQFLFPVLPCNNQLDSC